MIFLTYLNWHTQLAEFDIDTEIVFQFLHYKHYITMLLPTTIKETISIPEIPKENRPPPRGGGAGGISEYFGFLFCLEYDLDLS